jgi:hypothetical protein
MPQDLHGAVAFGERIHEVEDIVIPVGKISKRFTAKVSDFFGLGVFAGWNDLDFEPLHCKLSNLKLAGKVRVLFLHFLEKLCLP